MADSASTAATTADRPLQVVYKAISSLIPDPRNARTHPKRQIEQIAASMRAFGFTNPILADPQGNLIAGHGRLRAAKEMGLAEVPVIELSGWPTTRSRLMPGGMSRSSSLSLPTCRCRRSISISR
jgi:hypothetical protein